MTSGFHEIYSAFIRGVAAPFFADPESVVCQRDPTFRCVMPSDSAVGIPHCDADYLHQASEINFWLPLTRVYGSNTLWVESSPGLGDFHPLELEYGQAAVFYGNQCRHYTMANDTPTTRVSIDFRVIPGARFEADPELSRDSKGNQRFQLGQYYFRVPAAEAADAADEEPDASSLGKSL